MPKAQRLKAEERAEPEPSLAYVLGYDPNVGLADPYSNALAAKIMGCCANADRKDDKSGKIELLGDHPKGEYQDPDGVCYAFIPTVR